MEYHSPDTWRFSSQERLKLDLNGPIGQKSAPTFWNELGRVSSKDEQMKTVRYIRKRMAHLAIGPAVGAVVAGVLLTILMLNIA